VLVQKHQGWWLTANPTTLIRPIFNRLLIGHEIAALLKARRVNGKIFRSDS